MGVRARDRVHAIGDCQPRVRQPVERAGLLSVFAVMVSGCTGISLGQQSLILARKLLHTFVRPVDGGAAALHRTIRLNTPGMTDRKERARLAPCQFVGAGDPAGVHVRERDGGTRVVLCGVHTSRSNTSHTDNRRTRQKMHGLELSRVLQQVAQLYPAIPGDT